MYTGFSLVVLLVVCCFTSTETVGLLGTGAQNGHLDSHTAPELWLINSLVCWLCSTRQPQKCWCLSPTPPGSGCLEFAALPRLCHLLKFIVKQTPSAPRFRNSYPAGCLPLSNANCMLWTKKDGEPNEFFLPLKVLV